MAISPLMFTFSISNHNAGDSYIDSKNQLSYSRPVQPHHCNIPGGAELRNGYDEIVENLGSIEGQCFESRKELLRRAKVIIGVAATFMWKFAVWSYFFFMWGRFRICKKSYVKDCAAILDVKFICTLLLYKRIPFFTIWKRRKI